MDDLLKEIASRFSSGRWDDLDVQFLLKMAHIAASEGNVSAAKVASSYKESRTRRAITNRIPQGTGRQKL
jgi:hypothetical protein